MKGTIISRLKAITVVCLCLGVIFLGMGFHKKMKYENSRYNPVNAYVEGDAYNYVINSNYFAGYAVIGMGFLIISAITASQLSVILVRDEDKRYEKAPNSIDVMAFRKNNDN